MASPIELFATALLPLLDGPSVTIQSIVRGPPFALVVLKVIDSSAV